MKSLKKIILITGASSGIGKAGALQLIRDGYIVYGAARRTDQMRDIEKAGGFIISMDMTDEISIQSGIERIFHEQGRINVLWNNAGYAIYGAVEDTLLADARRQFEVNLFGLAGITQKVLPVMRHQRSGLIINTSSMGGKIYTPLGAWYHASKHALEGWSDCLRLEVKPFGIYVVILEPGIIATEFGNVMIDPLLARSGNGPYRKMAKSVANSTVKIYQRNNSSPPEVIAKMVSRIIRTKNPKTRYVAGKLAWPMIGLRKNLGDRLFDKILLSQLKN